jgi:hypothetical protein
VFGDFFKKSVLLALGGYDESIPFNEDSEFNYRVRQAGYSILLSPSIHVRYHVRSSLSGLARQMFRYGFWRRRTQLEHPRYVPWRIMVPPIMVLGTLLSLMVFALAKSPLGLVIPGMYAAFVGAATIAGAVRSRAPLSALCLPLVLPVMHFAYGTGWWAGFFVHRKRGVRGALHQVAATP